MQLHSANCPGNRLKSAADFRNEWERRFCERGSVRVRFLVECPGSCQAGGQVGKRKGAHVPRNAGRKSRCLFVKNKNVGELFPTSPGRV